MPARAVARIWPPPSDIRLPHRGSRHSRLRSTSAECPAPSSRLVSAAAPPPKVEGGRWKVGIFQASLHPGGGKRTARFDPAVIVVPCSRLQQSKRSWISDLYCGPILRHPAELLSGSQL